MRSRRPVEPVEQPVHLAKTDFLRELEGGEKVLRLDPLEAPCRERAYQPPLRGDDRISALDLPPGVGQFLHEIRFRAHRWRLVEILPV
jgi:hypothetical protein